MAVTGPGSSLERIAEEQGYRAVITAEPNVGGRYSALTAFGLVPSGLARANIADLIDDAELQSPLLAADDPANPALRLAAALAVGHAAGAEKVVLADTGSGIVGFGDWAEQLIAESTGKDGTGLLPVVVRNPAAPGFADAGPDATLVAIGPESGDAPDESSAAAAVTVSGTLGGQFLLWEYAIAVVGRLLGINPFDQPDVEAAKAAARAQLDALHKSAARPAPAFVEGDVAVYPVGDWLPDGVTTLSDALQALITATPARGYLAVQAYLDRIADASAAVLRTELARRSKLQTTFGWGPRYLHSTGQYHKGGHQNGSFLQLTGAVVTDIPVPGTDFYQPMSRHNVVQAADDSIGMSRTAISCARCDGHLGHVFDDGPKPTGLRYCMNSASLRFVARSKQQDPDRLGQSTAGQQGQATTPDRWPVRCRHLRRDRGPVSQETDAGDL